MRHGSLFSGIGGFDLASQWMGWENVFHCEWMDFPRKVLEYHFPNADSLIDITKTDFTKYEGTVDIISGGFPCQPFSMAGKRKGEEDERYLWDEMLRAIQEIKPKFVVAENVAGLVSIDEGLVLNKIITDLETQGYETQSFIIPACSLNAPHRRDRIFIIAYTQCKGLEGHNREWQGRTINRSDKGLFFRTEDKFTSTNTNCNGLNQRNSENEESSTITGFDALCHSDKGNGNGIVTHPKSNGNREQSRKNQKGDNRLSNNDGKNEITANTNINRLQGSIFTRCNGEQKRNRQKNTPEEYLHLHRGSELQGQRWDNFPTESSVCGRNDGISERLDNITFPKWRTESIKAYGNAVVPQVVYELFKIIEELNNNTDQ